VIPAMQIYSNHQVPVLLYHALFQGNANPEKYAIARDEFERHIRYLSENRFICLRFDDFLNGHWNEQNKKYIIISFDDGNFSDYSCAFPILKRYSMTATFFVTVNRIGADHYLEWQHIKEMAEGGMSIQSHSFNHVFLSDLDSKKLHTELYESKKILEQNLLRSIDFIALPGGFNSQKVLRSAEDVGYKGVVTSCPGLNRLKYKKEGFLHFNRFVITRKTQMHSFKNIVNANALYVLKSRMSYDLKLLAKKILGSKRYYQLWSTFIKYKT